MPDVVVSVPPRVNYLGLIIPRRPARLTVRRQHNLAKAFHQVEWDFQASTLRNYGRFGDRPQWNIPGRFGPLHLTYRHQPPMGGRTSLRIWNPVKRTMTIISPAPLREAPSIMRRLRELRGEPIRVILTRKK